MRKQHYMTEQERHQLEAMRRNKIPVREIARQLGFCERTIYYELRRGSYIHIIRPVQETAVYEPLRRRRNKVGYCILRQPGNQTVDMPGTVLVLFRHEQILYLRLVLLALVTHELRKAALIHVQVEAVEFRTIYRAGEKVVPRVAEGVLQHHVSSAAETVIQLIVIVLCGVLRPKVSIVRVTTALECDYLVDAVCILVDAVNGGGGNRHIASTSRNSLWCQVPSSELSLRPIEGSSDGAHPPDVHSKS